MRYLRVVHTHVPKGRRDEYLVLLGEMRDLCRSSELVRGFYLTEKRDAPGEFSEFYEFTDEEGAASFFEKTEEARELERRRDALASGEVSFWWQRM